VAALNPWCGCVHSNKCHYSCCVHSNKCADKVGSKHSAATVWSELAKGNMYNTNLYYTQLAVQPVQGRLMFMI
jgi:hypothetical protein